MVSLDFEEHDVQTVESQVVLQRAMIKNSLNVTTLSEIKIFN